MDYKFRRENGLCPQCVAFGKGYYIQDRYLGGQKYEYALMSKPAERKPGRKFSDVKKMMSFLLNEDITDDIAINLILGQLTVYRSGKYRMIENGINTYIWNEQEKELREYIRPKQETGYCETYHECLEMAMSFLKKKEQEQAGVQLSLFTV